VLEDERASRASDKRLGRSVANAIDQDNNAQDPQPAA
jgi:hypothetical protein